MTSQEAGTAGPLSAEEVSGSQSSGFLGIEKNRNVPWFSFWAPFCFKSLKTTTGELTDV